MTQSVSNYHEIALHYKYDVFEKDWSNSQGFVEFKVSGSFPFSYLVYIYILFLQKH